MYTKRELVEEAYEAIGLASYDFDLQPEELQAGMRKIDRMMASWSAAGINVGYALASTPTSGDLDQLSGAVDIANDAIILNAALRIAPSKGKQLSPATVAAAQAAYDDLVLWCSRPLPVQMRGGVPRGAGGRISGMRTQPFLRNPDLSPLQLDEGGNLEFLGD